jgi:hypothetical protein
LRTSPICIATTDALPQSRRRLERFRSSDMRKPAQDDIQRTRETGFDHHSVKTLNVKEWLFGTSESVFSANGLDVAPAS